MASYTIDDIRNIVLVGHAGAGKTTLAEAILHKTGATTRLGSVDDKTSILDCDEEEKERGHSIDSGLCHLNYKGKEINIIDTPGYPGFTGATVCAISAAETAVVVISAADGIQMNTLKYFQSAKDRGMAIMIVVNKIDNSPENLESLLETIQESFGRECQCINVASADGKKVTDCIWEKSGDGFIDIEEAHTNLLETVVEADEELMEAYLGGEEISHDKVDGTMHQAIVQENIIPVVFMSSREETGIEQFLDTIVKYCPNPKEGVKMNLLDSEGNSTPIEPDLNADLLGYVFRVSSDPKTNIKAISIKLQSGSLKSDTLLNKVGGKKTMRPGHVQKTQGDTLEQIEVGIAGDIITLSKLEELRVLDTVHTKELGSIQTPKMPNPMYSLALEPKSRGDETKISGVLHEIADADPTFKIDRDVQTHELIISGLGELHARVILNRMKSRRGLEVITHPPRIPYRETITTSVERVEYTHRKQSGGSGQFGRVFIDMEPNEQGAGYEFVDKIFGGSIDQPFRPSVDKGCRAAMEGGVLAGFPVVDVKVSLVDGKTHPVDSKDVAFQMAGREAFKIAFMKCNPTLLEPVVNIEVTVPSDKVGDITGDLSGRRGRVQGQDIMPGGMTCIMAQVPLAEVQQYSSQLKSVTGGQGSFSMELSHYEAAPPNVVQQVIAKVAAEKAAKEQG
ncbi:MAG: elongation factor G [Phycisphaerae bacterium]|nr:elongation factor G [Phycisphaerae bacterium]